MCQETTLTARIIQNVSEIMNHEGRQTDRPCKEIKHWCRSIQKLQHLLVLI